MSSGTRRVDKLGGDRRAVFFVLAAGVCALMIPFTPTDPAKTDASGAITVPPYSYRYVPITLICWCLALAVLSWLDNRVRLNQPTPLPPEAGVRVTTGTNGLAIASFVLGAVALALFGLWGLGAWGVLSILALLYGETARRETGGTGQTGRILAVAGSVLGLVGTVLIVIWVAKWLGNSLDTAFDKLREGEL